MSLHLPKSSRNGCFLGPEAGLTLIEIFVVIVITAVLLTMLFGGLMRAGILSGNSKCVANLRTVGFGALQFMHDRGGTLLPNKAYTNPSFRLDKPGFRDYVGISSTNTKVSAEEFLVDSAFTCPVIRKKYPERYPIYLNRCYLSNFYAYLDDPENLNDPPADRKPPSPRFAPRLVNIPSAAQMWMFADGCVPVAAGGNIPSYMKPAYASPSNSSYTIGFHNGRQNVVFFDGHIEALTKEDFHNRSPRYFWGILDATD